MRYLVAAITLTLVLSGCSSKKDFVSDYRSSQLYASANRRLQEGNYTDAIKELELLDNHYPFSPYTQQVQLDLIYAYYKSANFPRAHIFINRFLQLNPMHPNADYVFYMRGLTNMTRNDSASQIIFGGDLADRSPENVYVGFRDFTQLMRSYPNSQYLMDANKRLVYIKNRLAKHELAIVQYYNKRGAYVAVANRVERMLHDFPDTRATRQALPYLERAYHYLQLNNEAEKVMKIIALNPLPR
ncbi:outer membrane protein assembly factor BamD [secondary endosymbiont of Ctenarytaina eucalypti]|nr:outer membrane protein assembly factor BamD [secondary endosymbiont of Ctenarytaina eucalypti]